MYDNLFFKTFYETGVHTYTLNMIQFNVDFNITVVSRPSILSIDPLLFSTNDEYIVNLMGENMHRVTSCGWNNFKGVYQFKNSSFSTCALEERLELDSGYYYLWISDGEKIFNYSNSVRILDLPSTHIFFSKAFFI